MQKILCFVLAGLISTNALAGGCYIEKVEFQRYLKTEDGNILLYFSKLQNKQEVQVQVKWAGRLGYLISDGEIRGWEIKNKSALVLHNNDEIHVMGGSVHDWCDLTAIITPERKAIRVKAINLYGGANQSFDYFIDAKEISN